MEEYKKFIYLGIITIALGVTFSSGLNRGSLGTVLIALGGLFFIIGMSKKKDLEE